MIYYYLTSLIAILISTQNNFLLWPSIPIVFAACWEASLTRVLTLALISGLLLDLFLGHTLGIYALLFILSVGLVQLIKSRFSDNWRIFLAVIILCQIVYYVIR